MTTNIIQTAERMIRDNSTTIGAICAEWNRINFEANTGLSFSTPKTRKALVAKLEAAIIELNSRDPRMVDGVDDREFSGNSIAAAHAEALRINKEETPRYFVADFVYKVSKSGFVYRWVNESREWVDVQIGIRNLINMGALEVTEADINAYTTIGNGRAVYSTDKGRHFVLLDSKHLYEFSNEYDAVSYANRINGL